MNIVLAITILVALAAATFVRCVSLYNIKYNTNKLDNVSNIAILVMYISTLIFIVEFIFSPFNIIL